MAAKKRETSSRLRERLLEEYHGFEFFKAVPLCECLLPEKERIGKTLMPSQEAVRFSASLGFGFPPSDITRIRLDEENGQVRMEVAFVGLIGPSGVLPHWMHELALERIREKDHTFADFLNIFHHRLVSLFYLAWRRPRISEHYRQGAQDRLSSYLLSLLGLGTPGLMDRLDLSPESLIFCSGLLSRLPPTAESVEKAIAYFSETEVSVEQFVERLLPLSPEEQSQLGANNASLGLDSVCGSHVWDAQSFFHIQLGPMDWERFVKLLPSGTILPAVFSLARYIVGIEYEFDVRLYVKREDVPPCRLGDPDPGGARLGWSTWIKSPEYVPVEDPYVTFDHP